MPNIDKRVTQNKKTEWKKKKRKNDNNMRSFKFHNLKWRNNKNKQKNNNLEIVEKKNRLASMQTICQADS